MLLHGIMSSIAEFYSKNLATEVTKGLAQKFETGGTPMSAPIGYLNVRARDDQGGEYRTMEIDPDRAPLIRWVFEKYATGDRTVVDLLSEVTARGLTTVPTRKRPSGPMARSGFFKILRNPYYIGIVRYKGAEQPGTHEPSSTSTHGSTSNNSSTRARSPPNGDAHTTTTSKAPCTADRADH